MERLQEGPCAEHEGVGGVPPVIVRDGARCGHIRRGY